MKQEAKTTLLVRFGRELQTVETIANKNGANIDVLVGGGETPMWNIRR